MLISPAYAQAAAPAAGGDLLMSMLPLLAIFLVFYFVLIRPQQGKAKQHKAMIDGLKRGDQVVTAGGLIGKVVKVEQGEANVLLVEVAPNVQVRVVRHTVADQLNKPVLSNDNQSAAPTAGIGGFLGKLLGKK
ncbi:MAG: preprotein translocase subunit YajC [Geminicoccaceae bacterium]